jgi:ribitol-5-phosphate 2-dehydrogenase
MIGRIYQLVDTKRIEMIQREVTFEEGMVLLKPDYMSVCSADQRYFFGERSREVLSAKLPMALIHEATGTVVHDGSGNFKRGEKAVLVPLVENRRNALMKANYDPQNGFMSSGCDGFMRDYIALPPESVIRIKGDYAENYVFSELISVIFNALDAFERVSARAPQSFGIWGNGNVGYITGLVLNFVYPEAKIYVVGRTERKLHRFSFAQETFTTDRVPKDLAPDHCFECVGGDNSGAAINQIISTIRPQGTVSLLGVSENLVPINTRTVLDKGIIFIGNSRSTKEDMRKAVDFIDNNAICHQYLHKLVSELIEVKNERDIVRAFESSRLNDFKTVMKWSI